MTRIAGMSPTHQPRSGREFLICVCGRKLSWNSTLKIIQHKNQNGSRS